MKEVSVYCKDKKAQLLRQLDECGIFKGEVKIFKFLVSDYIHQLHLFLSILNDEENHKAVAFRKDEDRARYIIGRGLLKIFLSKFSGKAIHTISIVPSDNRKPYLYSPHNSGLYFNLSHSGQYVVIAFTATDVGIDIEQIKPDFEFADVVANYFSDEEISTIKKAGNARKQFYKYWARKEALLKATGVGVIDYLQEVNCLDGINNVSSFIIQSDNDWLISSFETRDGYALSVAHDLQSTLQFYCLSPEDVIAML